MKASCKFYFGHINLLHSVIASASVPCIRFHLLYIYLEHFLSHKSLEYSPLHYLYHSISHGCQFPVVFSNRRLPVNALCSL